MTVTGTSIPADISPREAEVLAALGEHLTNAEIAARLYISVRTVESHVSSLLRKLGVADRRELAALAPAATASAAPAEGTPEPVLPVPLTSFIGRSAERAALAEAVRQNRLVTATGPGGVGKTRLAVAVAADVMPGLADAGWFVDLVPVTDPAMVAAAVAGPLGVAERQGGSVEDAVLHRLARSEALVVLDNCEHVVDGVATFVERLLGACPGVRVLATSRARLVLPFERVFPVPGLSLATGPPEPAGDDACDAVCDAVALFIDRARAAAAGGFQPTVDERGRIAAVCGALDGMALAIELAAARMPTLGLDGIESGLGDALRLLAGGPRLDQRHQSLRSTIDWSYQLLDPAGRALLRRVSVFAAPFTVGAAATVAVTGDAGDPLAPEVVADQLARLADHSLLVAVPGSETRYRVLETIRQHGEERLAAAGELMTVRARHLRWCLDTAAALQPRTALPGYGDELEPVVDDLRAALIWASEHPEWRAEAHRLARLVAELIFLCGHPAEAQRRYEHAARLAPDDATAADDLADAAGAAASRQVGNEGLRLLRETADAAVRAGDRPAAARHLAIAAQMIRRCPGIIAELPPEGTVETLLADATALAPGHPRVEPAVLVARAYQGAEVDPVTLELAERAVELARRAGDTEIESAALDMLTAVHLAVGDVPAAVATVRRRTELLASFAPEPQLALELADGYAMAAEVHLTAGDFAAARFFAERNAALPFLREQRHLAVARTIKVEAMAGEIGTVLRAGDRFRRDWDRAGRPVATNLGGASYAVAMVHALRGDAAGRDEWVAISSELGVTGERMKGCVEGYSPCYDSIVALHHGAADAAVARLTADPEELPYWYTGQWRPWYAALWAEAAVLAGGPDPAARIDRARQIAAANPVALAMVERAAALLAGDRAALRRVAAVLEPLGCPYQRARTLVLAGGDDRADGEAALAALGAAPMAVD